MYSNYFEYLIHGKGREGIGERGRRGVAAIILVQYIHSSQYI